MNSYILPLAPILLYVKNALQEFPKKVFKKGNMVSKGLSKPPYPYLSPSFSYNKKPFLEKDWNPLQRPPEALQFHLDKQLFWGLLCSVTAYLRTSIGVHPWLNASLRMR